MEMIEEIAEKLYSKEMPYHNFNHAIKVAGKGLEIAQNCMDEGIEVNKTVVYLALLFHDAGYHENHQEKGFETKEEYSAHLAGIYLGESGYVNEVIEQIKKAIISTHREAKFETIEEKIVRAADLSGLAAEYEEFLKNSTNLKEEYEMLSGKKIGIEEWKEMTKKIIAFYLSQEIKLTSKYYGEEGESKFHKKAKENLKKFLEEEKI